MRPEERAQSLGAQPGVRKMRIASLTALLVTIAVPAAAEPDWKTVAQALGFPPGRRSLSGRPAAYRPESHPRWRRDQAGLRAWLLARIQADGQRCHGHG